jgi:2-methylcitrate dehydratase PrpD
MLCEELAQRALAIASADLDEAVRHAARRCLVDWAAAALPGSALDPTPRLREALADELDRGTASILPDGRAATPRAAALHNGTAAHAAEFDDIFRDAIYHPGAPVISAALAAAEHTGCDGRRLLGAVVAGYEVSCRIGLAVTPAHYEHFHTTGTVGTLGAAVAGAVALGLDEQGITHALAGAATQAAGLQQAFRSDSMSKPLHAGRAAESGVLCALLAAQGVTGALDVLEGERGFGQALGGGARWDRALEGLGEDFVITRMTQKNHGCCGHTFAALDALIALRAEHGLEPADVARVEVGTYAKAVEVVGDASPATPSEARFSLPYCAAVALTDGRVRLASFEPARIADPGLRTLMTRVEVGVDAEADAAFPGRRGARVVVETADERRFERRARTRKGDPEAPLGDSELEAKYRELATPVIGAERAQSLLASLWTLDRRPALRGLL